MTDNFTDWLNSIDNNDALEEVLKNPNDASEASREAHPEESSPTELSAADFEDILASNGFISEEEQEEVGEEEDNIPSWVPNELPYDENGEEGRNLETEEEDGEERDLDAEEDEEWEERLASGEINEVTQEEAPLERDILQRNSLTLLMDTTTSRFSGTEWYNEIQKSRIILAGLGGIGSWAALQIARMHPTSLILYDPDRVEAVNMSGQLYSTQNIGDYKVEAIANLIGKYTSMQSVFAIRERFTKESEAGDIMICGFDNMSARRVFFNKWREHVLSKPEEERKNCVFIDGRLSIDTLQVFCITGKDEFNMQRYEREFLFSDSEADATVCSMKQTTYLACMIGSVIVNLFTNFIAGLLNPIIPYDLPFFTQYEAQHMLFKTEN